MFAPQGQEGSRAVARALTTIRFQARGRVMRPVRTVLAAAAVAATALVTLTTAIGGTAASAATVHAAHTAALQAPHDAARRPATMATGLTWHPFTLLNGWQSAQGQYSTGDPAWAAKNGIVYLSGSLTQPAADTIDEVAVLPKAAWPAAAQSPSVVSYTYDGTQGFVDVTSQGVVYAFGATYSNAQAYTSLAGISYPAASTATTKLTLRNGWQENGSALGPDTPAYVLTGGVVHLVGDIKQPSGSNPEFAVLPAGARPAHTAYFLVRVPGNAVGTLAIKPDGQMSATGTGAQVATDLSGVSFAAASTGTTTLALQNGWQSAQGQFSTGDPAFSVTGGVVHLSGSLVQPGGGNEQFAVLPPSARPAHNVYLTTLDYNGEPGAVEIQPNGAMFAFSPISGNAQSFTELAGASYPVGS
jgi:hypothetical protein